jgi:hypothetical protein
MKFIPIDWKVARNNCYVNIDCYIINEKGNKELKLEICDRCIDACNLEPFNCDPDSGIRIQVLDNAGKLLAERKWEKNVQRIIIDKDEFLHYKIDIE